MSDDDEIPNIVIDAGSGMFRMGFAGDDAPRCVFPSVLGSQKYSHNKGELSRPDGFVGDEAQEMRDFLSLRYPIKHGTVTDWNDMEKLLMYGYKQLDVESVKHPLLLSQAPLTSKSNKEHLAQLMFETFDVPALFLPDSSTLCLYSCGRGSGVMVDIGDGVSSAIPFYEGFWFPDGFQRQDFAGRDLTFFLQKLLQQRGSSFTTTSEADVVRDIKKELCYTALDFDREKCLADKAPQEFESTYDLSDGSKISLTSERFQCMEALFQPSLCGFHGLLGIQDMVYNAIQSCPIDMRKDISNSIMCSGGIVLCPGFKERLLKEMEEMLPKTKRVRVNAYPEANYVTWIGGSILGSLSTFQPDLVPKQSYEEYGPSIFT